jgi:uncharacterized membrane protein YqjE
VLGIVSQAKRVRERMEALARLNLDLARVEGKQKATALGIALGLAGLAAVLVLYAIGFLFAAAAAGLAEELPLWLSLIVVAVVILVFAALAGFVARRSARKLSVPSQAVEQTKRTVDTVRTHV